MRAFGFAISPASERCLGVPMAGATLPVAAFLLLGIYGQVIWMVLSAAVLGIGHIGIHWQHRRALAG